MTSCLQKAEHLGKQQSFMPTLFMWQTTSENLSSEEPSGLDGMGRLLSCLLLPVPTQLICEEAEADEPHLQAGQGKPGSNSG